MTLAYRIYLISTALLIAISSGCSAIPESIYLPLLPVKSLADESASHQQKYLETGDPESLRWLLQHQIRTGMPVGDVNRVLGQNGTRVHGSREMLRNSGSYREDDHLYRWGPDSKGQTYHLVFRAGKLVNYDAHLYNETKSEFDWSE